MESEANMFSPELDDPALKVSSSFSGGELAPYSAKFGNGLRISTSDAYYQGLAIRPKGSYSGTQPSQGTISFWLLKIGFTTHDFLGINIGDSSSGDLSNIFIYRDKILVYTPMGYLPSIAFDFTGTFHHVYITWDKDENLSGSQSLKIFVDGTELFSSSGTINTANATFGMSVSNSAGGSGSMDLVIDNLKIWDQVVSETPDWEYVDQKEESIHKCYGVANDYKPSSDIKVGYYKLAGNVDWPDEGEMYYQEEGILLENDVIKSLFYANFAPY